MKNVLVTGATGFLGGKLCQQLVERGYSVSALVRKDAPSLEKLGVSLFRGDLDQSDVMQEACRGKQQVFHCAAVAGAWGQRKFFYHANVTGTANLLAAAQKNGVADFIFTSSPSVTFQAPGNEGDDERIPYPDNFLSFYSETKALAEKLVVAANGQQGLRTVSLRPHLIYGPGDPHLIPRFVAACKAGRLKQIGSGQNKVDVTYIDNAAWSHVLAAEALATTGKPAGKAYFIGDGDPVNLWDWLNHLMERLELPKLAQGPGASKAILLARVVEWVYRNFRLAGEPPVTRFMVEHLVYPHYYDMSAAANDFNYHSIVGEREALEKTVEWARSLS